MDLAHFLVPKHTNNHKAKALHPSFLTLIAIGVVLFQFGLNFFSQAEGSVLGYAANISVEEVVKLTNQKRAEAGLPALKLNSRLSEAAAAKGAHMLSFDYWAHVAPDGTQPWKFFADIGYKYRYAGENLARDFSNPTAAVNAWMASPTHKENMLSSKYQEIGIGVVEGDLGGVDTTLIVQFFGATFVDPAPVAPVAAAQTTATAAPKPTPAVTPVPTSVAVPVALSSPTVNMSAGPVQAQMLISPFATTKGLSTAIIGFLLLLLLIDIIVIARRRITRISSRSMAHVAFLGMILAIILIIQAGRIL